MNYYSDKINKILQNVELKNVLLSYYIGNDKAYFTFITYIINNMFKDKDDYTNNYKAFNMNFFFHSIIKLLKFKKIEKLDVLFLSRYRPILIEGYRKDYLFYKVIDNMKNNYEYIIGIASIDSLMHKYDGQYSYNLFDAIDFEIIIKAIYNSIILYIRSRSLLKKMSMHDIDLLSNYFKFKYILVQNVMNFCLNKFILLTEPSIIVVNDDALRFKPKKYKNIMLTVQSATMNENVEKLFHKLSIIMPEYVLRKSHYFFVNGHADKLVKEKYDFDTYNVILNGQIRYDDYYNHKNTAKYKVKGFSDNPKEILWATQTHGLSINENKLNVLLIKDILKKYSNICVTIKLHPGEDQTGKIYRELNNNRIKTLNSNYNISELIMACDIFMTKHSTSAIEAMIYEKPILILNVSGEQLGLPYIEYGSAFKVGSIDDFDYYLKNVHGLYRKKMYQNQQSFLNDYNFGNDGKSSLRLVKFITKLLQTQVLEG